MRTFVLLAFLAMAPLVHALGTFSEAGEKPYMDRKDWRGLLGYNEAWTRAEPNNPMAWYGLGMTYRVGFNQPGDAADSFRRALALNPEWPEAWAQLSAAYSTMPGRHNDVLQALREEQQHMSHASSADWFRLGLNFNNNGSIMDHKPYSEAVSAYTRALTLNARDPAIWNNRGVSEHALGNDGAALNDYQQAAQLGSRLGGQNYTQLQRDLAAQAEQAKQAASRPHAPAANCYRSSSIDCKNDPSSNIYHESRGIPVSN